jgi:hypothetical protein
MMRSVGFPPDIAFSLSHLTRVLSSICLGSLPHAFWRTPNVFVYLFLSNYFFLLLLPLFSPQFRGIKLVVVTVLSHRCNSSMDSGETRVESHESSETQPNQATLLLDTMPIQPGSQPHQCVGGNKVQLATWSGTGVASA